MNDAAAANFYLTRLVKNRPVDSQQSLMTPTYDPPDPHQLSNLSGSLR
jgi:hypothetical protein